MRYLPVLTAIHAADDRPFDTHRERLLALSKLLYIRKWYSGWSPAAMHTGVVLFYLRRLLDQRRAGLSGRRQWTHLEPTLRPNWNHYGPAQR